MKFLDTFREIRSLFFAGLEARRLNRVLFCGFVIAVIWCFADFRSGTISINPVDDFICLALGVITERLIPWGKPQPSKKYKLVGEDTD